MRIATFLLAAILVATACGDGSPSTTTAGEVVSTTSTTMAAPTSAAPDGVPLRGFSLSPRSTAEEDFTGFFETASRAGDLVARVGDIAELGDPESGVAVVDALAERYDYLSVPIVGVARTEDGAPLRPLDPATVTDYVDDVLAYAAEEEPAYLGLGVEVDTQWRTHPEDFEAFVGLFAEVAAAIDEVSPGTRLLTVFQLERLSGQGGPIGVDPEPDWDLIDRFPGADVIGFTTYPGLAFPSPETIPDDYYAEIAAHVDGRPVAFTEMGWQAAGSAGEYAGSPEDQAAFLERFDALIADLEVAFYVWSFLYDQPAPEPFDTMGLFDVDGDPRPAWEVWQDD